MDHRRGRGDLFKGPHSEDEAGRAFVQEARENLSMSKFLVSDSLTFAPMHSFVNLSTIIEEKESPDSIPKETVKNMSECSCSVVSVMKKGLLDVGVVEVETQNPALFRNQGRFFLGKTIGTREQDSNLNCRASEIDDRLLPLNSSRWPLGSSSKQGVHDRSTIFKLEQPHIVLQGLAARFESSNTILGNNKAPSPPKRQKSMNDDEEDVISLDDDDDEFFIDNHKAISAEQEPPNSDYPKYINDSSR